MKGCLRRQVSVCLCNIVLIEKAGGKIVDTTGDEESREENKDQPPTQINSADHETYDNFEEGLDGTRSKNNDEQNKKK